MPPDINVEIKGTEELSPQYSADEQCIFDNLLQEQQRLGLPPLVSGTIKKDSKGRPKTLLGFPIEWVDASGNR